MVLLEFKELHIHYSNPVRYSSGLLASEKLSDWYKGCKVSAQRP
jgi:hypothetical protein